MTRAELVRVVDIVAAAWSMRIGSDEHVRMVRTWWRYLQDLDYGDTLNAVDRFVVRAESFPPKVGELRKAVMDTTNPSGLPTAAQAWTQAVDRLRAVETGTTWGELHPAVTAAMRDAGMDGRKTIDEKTFRASYLRVVADLEESRLLPEHPEPFGEMPK